MNRELKFRAWIKKYKRMSEVTSLFPRKKSLQCTFDRYTFDEVELMEYTGLNDKNGVEIYEGDIIGYTDWEEKMRVDGVVKYGEFNCSCCEGVYGWYIDGGDIRNIKSCEVIGNVWENGELLKESEE